MKKNKYSTPLWMLATILAGMLSPMQSAVNGQLGHWLQDGNACAVISFASGLVVMFFIIMARKETRQQFAAIPSLIKNRKVPLWNWFAGLCGAMVVFSEGASASALGVATFQTALISALLLSGLLCDRFGIGVDEKKYFTPYRIIGALFAVIATIFVVSPQWHSTSFTGVIVALLQYSGDIFPDGSRRAIVKFVNCQFCQPVVNGRVKGFQLRKGKFITRVGIHFSRVS